MRAIIFCALAVSASSCLTYQAPARFLVVDKGGGEIKAITPEESKLWVRSFSDADHGGLAFWADALRADLKTNRGYMIVSEADVKDADGNAGKEIVLESTVNGQPVRELLAVFVHPGWMSDSLRVLEYVAPKAAFDKEVDGVRASEASLK